MADGLTHVQILLPGISRRLRKANPKGLTPIQQRLITSPAVTDETSENILYQHSGLCQTCLPYRDPGDDIRTWERSNGSSRLQLQAGQAYYGERFVEIGLPFGPKSRIILAHLNTEALRTGSPEIETAKTITAFVSRIGLATHGRNMRSIKDQLARLSATTIRIGRMSNGIATTTTGQIVGKFDVSFPKDERQRVLWPCTVVLSSDYFESLQRHAVPLNESAIAALSHSAMALDIYAWLAQRLHRIPAGKPASVPWTCLQGQFGWDYTRIRAFRVDFKTALAQVLTQYQAARLSVTEKGLSLWNSQPPVKNRLLIISGTESISLPPSAS
jgi:hypothetical protein